MDFLQTPIEYLRGIGPQRAEIFRKEIAVYTFGDLLYYFPYKHIDKSKIYTVNDVLNERPDYAQILGSVEDLQVLQQKFGRRLVVQLRDEKNQYIELVWFNGVQFWQKNLLMKKKYIVFGKIGYFMNRVQIVHPEIEDYAIWQQNPKLQLYPMYNTTEKMKAKNLNTKTIAKATQELVLQLQNQNIPENIPTYLIKNLGLLHLRESLINMHFPKNLHDLKHAIYRNKFEELFFLQLRYNYIKKERHHKQGGCQFDKVGNFFNDFYNQHLPFSLTNAQKKVLREIRQDTGSGFQMNRLLQGDVGSGKTIVALLAVLLALDNGYQACIMAPTEILAFQHFENIQSLVKELPINVSLLTGSTKGKQKKQLLQALFDAHIHILIGTHALIEDNVKFQKLGLVVIDEQHRFGVEQRSKLAQKGNPYPHILVMTATPIPRSLALTVYGDLDYSVIDELPPGRKSIKTLHRYDLARGEVMKFIATEIQKGRQIYIIFPLIEESETLDYENIMEGYEQVKMYFPEEKYKISVLHGRQSTEEKEINMQRFKEGKTQIMVSTTVIEVGVNVPNASVMVIESTEKFGLSQLHQLRGRVGRGSEQSYCILLSGRNLSLPAKQRIQIMCSTNNGFIIAEKDMELRGPGDIDGTRQSGMLPLKLANLTEDKDLLIQAQIQAIAILDQDPSLSEPQNALLKQHVQLHRLQQRWSKIL